MLLSFMLELLSRHSYGLLMKGIAWLGVGCLCVCVYLHRWTIVCSICVCMHKPVCWASVRYVCLRLLIRTCVFECVGGDCGDSCTGLRSMTTWPPTTIKGQRLSSPWDHIMACQLCHGLPTWVRWHMSQIMCTDLGWTFSIISIYEYTCIHYTESHCINMNFLA